MTLARVRTDRKRLGKKVRVRTHVAKHLSFCVFVHGGIGN